MSAMLRTSKLACALLACALAAGTVPSGTRADDGDARAIAELKGMVAQLEQRLTRVQDADQIELLVSAYGYYLDKQQWDQLTDLFAEDGRMEISLRGVYVGKKSIRRALELFGPQNIEPDHLHDHIQLQPVITVSADGSHAFSRSRALSELGTYQRVGMWGDGVYTNTYVKQNGVWKIAYDHIYTGFFANYDKGWQSGAGPAPKVSEKIPPDLPPTELYESYPGQYIPPFQYRHPVTGAPIEIPASLQVKPNANREAVPAQAPSAQATTDSPDARGRRSKGTRERGLQP